MLDLREYTGGSRELYHFETSDQFVSQAKIRIAQEKTLQARQWDDSDRAQLEAIVNLELLRSRLAEGKVTFDHYKLEVGQQIESFFAEVHRHIFDDNEVHEEFYRQLNEVYR